jgi:hypothetical protein
VSGLPHRHGHGHWSRVTRRRVLLALIVLASLADMELAALLLHRLGHDEYAIAVAAVPVIAIAGCICLYYAGEPDDHPIHGRRGRHSRPRADHPHRGEPDARTRKIHPLPLPRPRHTEPVVAPCPN